MTSRRRPFGSARSSGLLGCVLLAVLLPASRLALADDNSPQRIVQRLGACKILSLEKSDKGADCLGTMVETTYAGDRTDFLFTTKDKLSVTFRGTGAPTVDPNDASSLQTLDAVIVSKDNRPSRSQATGTCRFSPPIAGPSPIICRAQSWLGLFQAVFLTNGRVASPTNE